MEAVVDNISQGSASVDIGSGQAQYGSALYGTATYGGAGRRMFHQTLPLEAEGRTVWLKTSYSGQETFRHFTYSFGIVPEPVPRRFSD